MEIAVVVDLVAAHGTLARHGYLPQTPQRRLAPQHGRLRGVESFCVGGTLGRRLQHAFRTADFRNPEPTAEQRFDVAERGRGKPRFVHVALHPGEAVKVLLDVIGGHLAVQAELLREAEGAHPVDESEIDHLGHAALFRGHPLERHAENFRRGRAVDVLAAGERPEKRLVLRKMRHDAQLDLGIVGVDDHRAGPSAEGGADPTAFGRAGGNVLEIGLRARQSSRHRGCLSEGRVHAAVRRIDHAGKLLEVRAPKLGEPTMLEHDACNGIVERKLAEHLLVRGGSPRSGLLAHGNAHVGEKHLGELLRTGEIEFSSGRFGGLGLQAVDLLGEFARLLEKHPAVDLHSRRLHFEKHGQERALDLMVDAGALGIRSECEGEVRMERAHGGSFLGQKTGDGVRIGVAPAEALRAFAENGVPLRNRSAQVPPRELRELMRKVRFKNVVHEHHVVDAAAHADAHARERMKSRLGVVHRLGRFALEPRPQRLKRSRCGEAGRRLDDVNLEGRKRECRRSDVGFSSLAVVEKRKRHGFRTRLRQRAEESRQSRFVRDAHVGKIILLKGRRRLADRRERIGRRLGGGRDASGRGARLRAVHARRRHLPALREALERRFVRIPKGKIGRSADTGHDGIALHGDERSGVLKEGKPRAKVLARFAGHFIRVLDEAVETAPLSDPLCGRLRSAALDPGNVVDLVAHERKIVDDALGRHAVLLKHARAVVELVVHRVEKRDAFAHKLREILVARRDHHFVARFAREAGEARDDVVGLNARHDVDGPAQEPDALLKRGDLNAEVVGHRRTVRLVLGEAFMAEGLSRRVEDDRGSVRLHGGGHLAQHSEKALDRPRRLARRRRQGGHRVVRPEEVVGSVDQKNFGHE